MASKNEKNKNPDIDCKGCDDSEEFCVPEIFRTGWLGSSFVWIAILVTIIILWILACYVNFDSTWFINLVKPAGLVPRWGFYTLQFIVIFLILIGIIMATHSQKTKPMLCAIILYVFLLGAYFAWLFGFINYQMIGASIFTLFVTIVITIWISWLVTNPEKGAKGWFPMVTFLIFLVWLILMMYYNISFYVLNTNGCGC